MKILWILMLLFWSSTSVIAQEGATAEPGKNLNFKELQICKRRVYLDFKRKLIKKNEAIDRLQGCRASAAFSKALADCKRGVIRQYQDEKIDRIKAKEELKQCPELARNHASKVRSEAQANMQERNNCIQAVLSDWLVKKVIDKPTAKARIEDCKLGPQTFQGCSQSIMTQLRSGKLSEEEAKTGIANCMVK